MGLNVDIRIDELVLHGFPYASRHRIAAALEAELARLVLGERRSMETRREGFARDDIALNLRLPHGATPERTGRALARSVHASLGSEPAATGSTRR